MTRAQTRMPHREMSARTDAFPMTWELPAAITATWLLLAALALPTGQALASAATGHGAVWPTGHLTTSITGLLTGHTGTGQSETPDTRPHHPARPGHYQNRGQPVTHGHNPHPARPGRPRQPRLRADNGTTTASADHNVQVAPTGLVYATILALEGTLLGLLAWGTRLWWRLAGPGVRHGMARTAQVADVLGSHPLRAKATIIRPDLHPSQRQSASSRSRSRR